MRKFFLNRNLSFLGVIAICLCLISGASLAGENTDKERAEKHFKAGVSLLATDNFLVAAQEFESSVKLHATKSGFFNLAICYYELRRYTDASAAIERLKSVFGNDLDEQWKTEIAAFEEKMKASVVPIQFRTNIEKADIKVDGKKINNSTKNEPQLLAPGDHAITITSEDYEQISETIRIDSQQTETVYHFLLVNPSEKRRKEQETIIQETTHPVHFENQSAKKKNSRNNGLKIGAAVTLGIGGITGLTAIATGVVHLVGVSRIKDSDSCKGNTCSDFELKSELNKMKKLGVATNVLISVSAVSLVTGTILAIVNGNSKKHRNRRVSIDPVIGHNGNGFALSGSF